MRHQYIHRKTGEVRDETLLSDKMINFLYSTVREHSFTFFNALTSKRFSSLMGYINFDIPILSSKFFVQHFIDKLKIDFTETVKKREDFKTPREIFERKIKYWECRPMDNNFDIIVSPADSKVLVGSFKKNSIIFIKDKFFNYEELLSNDKKQWLKVFENGDFIICRLTPEKYHFNHVPVNGVVKDFYAIEGSYHSCNPDAVISIATPYSKNKRIVTIFDTNVENGSQIGFVAMIEVVAMLVGDIRQCYSEYKYETPIEDIREKFLKKGQVKSIFRPGSSTIILIFEKDKITFSEDIVSNMFRKDVTSRFSSGFQQPLVETEIDVRSEIGRKN